MRFAYILYPEAKEKLRSSGLQELLEEAAKKNKLPGTFGAIYEDDMPQYLAELKEHFSTAPPKFLHAYKKNLQSAFANRQKHQWIVRKQQEERENCENEDILLMSGYVASFVLKPDSFWDAKKYGFDNPYQLFGALGAAVWMHGKRLNPFDEGYSWTSKDCNTVTEITGSEHGDLRILRNDITTYETLDPLGNKVSYRPQLSSDSARLSTHHSTETSLLTALFRYAEQEKYECKELTLQGLSGLLEEFRQRGQRTGPFGDFGGDGDDAFHARLLFARFSTPLPRWNTNDRCAYRLCNEEGGDYGIYIEDQSIVFAYHSNGKTEQRTETMRFCQDEIPHLVKGLFVQATRDLGRTSVGQLVEVYKYRFSEQFKQDQEESKIT